ncbi:MAG TPA: S-methyl-5-thioribose-1-phosphate isomerase [Gemmatirosa sp.]|nr:S-methyl-5-thioribose-1-phosphate isomerase [Gemmatirosa sp.]
MTAAIPRAVDWAPSGDAVRILDQRRLPASAEWRDLRSVDEVYDAIRTLAVRGAPAIGVCAALGLAVAMRAHVDLPAARFATCLADAAARIRGARPTAVNLAWAVDRLLARAAAVTAAGMTPPAVAAALRAEADAVLEEDRRTCAAIGEHGAALLERLVARRADRDPGAPLVVHTHCNAGALATAGIGTALAPVYVLHARGRPVRVWADETRPLLQGSRITAWELARAGIPVTVIADGMAAALLQRGGVDVVCVGADRIAANGDVANKIGTYALALAARAHGVPFVVLAPTSTVDVACATGAAIPIEERDGDELRTALGHPLAAPGVAVWNPAFDVTPAALVSAIVTERGVREPPYAFAASP